MEQLRIDDELKKDGYVRIRLNDKDVAKFKEICKRNNVTMSQVLRSMIDKYNEKGGF